MMDKLATWDYSTLRNTLILAVILSPLLILFVMILFSGKPKK
jgi:hypothetical protein